MALGETEIPTLAAWAGGPERFRALFETFYAAVPNHPVLAPVFAGMNLRHGRLPVSAVGL